MVNVFGENFCSKFLVRSDMPQIWKPEIYKVSWTNLVFASFSSHLDFPLVCMLSIGTWWGGWEFFYRSFPDESMRFAWVLVWLRLCMKVCCNRFEVLGFVAAAFFEKKSIFWAAEVFRNSLNCLLGFCLLFDGIPCMCLLPFQVARCGIPLNCDK